MAILPLVLLMSVVAWVVSLAKHDVSIVDSLWSLMILSCLLLYVVLAEQTGPGAWLVIAMTSI